MKNMALSISHDVVIRLPIGFQRLFGPSKVIRSTHDVAGESCRKMGNATDTESLSFGLIKHMRWHPDGMTDF